MLNLRYQLHLLFQFCFIWILVLNYGGKWPSGEREPYDTHDHEYDANDFLAHWNRRDISVAHSHYSCHSEVEACRVQLTVLQVHVILWVDPVVLGLFVKTGYEYPNYFKLNSYIFYQKHATICTNSKKIISKKNNRSIPTPIFNIS